jgi:hypothetical protein
VLGGDPALATALERCAARDPAGLSELRAWQGGRLRQTLLRTLGDEALADRALDEVLADLWDNAAVHHALGRGPAEDRVFALLRRHAHALLRAPAAPVPQRGPAHDEPAARREPPAPAPAPAPVPPPERPPLTTAPPVVAVPPVVVPGPARRPEPAAPSVATVPPAPASPARWPEPVAPRVAALSPEADHLDDTRRMRRPAITAASPLRSYPELPERHLAEPARGRWLLLLLVWMLAAGVGFGMAFLALHLSGNHDPVGWWQAGESAPAPQVAPAPPMAPAPPATVAAPAGTPAPDLGEPLVATEPPMTVLRQLELRDEPVTPARPRPAPDPPDPALAIAPAPPPPSPRPRPIVEAVLPAQARIFIHFRSDDDGSVARAQTLQNDLQRRGAGFVRLVPVRFAVETPSVRYFYPEDRLVADRLLQGARRELGAGRLPAPSEPTDFTRFRPSPSPGTIEVWLPGR